MNYTAFVIAYTKNHLYMSNQELENAISIAWQRYLDAHVCDELEHWMQDRMLEISTKKALARLGAHV